MHSTPTDLALRHLTAAKNTLETLITASESFDYPKAKAALEELKSRVRALARAKAEMEQARPVQPNLIRAEFGDKPRI